VPPPRTTSPLAPALALAGLAVLLPLGLVWAIELAGRSLAPAGPSLAGVSAAGPSGADTLWHVLLALAAVVGLGRLLGAVCLRIGQPRVIGEVLAGIVLGPSVLGAVAPGLAAALMTAAVGPVLTVLAQLGVIVYMFLVGVELNPALVRAHLRTVFAVSYASIAVPFVCGAGLALYLYPRFATAGVPFLHYALFTGIATAITAFPVLARILADRSLSDTPLGALALTCAALSDVTAWCALAVVVGITRGAGFDAVRTTALAAVFVGLMLVVVRPWMVRLSQVATGAASSRAVATVLMALLGAALATEGIGIHAIFGAFVLGVLVPHDSPLARVLTGGVGDLATVLLLPAFFAVTGMRTELGRLNGADAWIAGALVIAVATVGKGAGTAVAGRLMGMTWRHAAALGALMNTRGLMELIVLGVGLDLGVISPAVFTMFVVMALVTTAATAPALALLLPSAAGTAPGGRQGASQV
jgi:Kef-type K+ transport system membrane component KefB